MLKKRKVARFVRLRVRKTDSRVAQRVLLLEIFISVFAFFPVSIKLSATSCLLVHKRTNINENVSSLASFRH